jgi:hypothetical protein
VEGQRAATRQLGSTDEGHRYTRLPVGETLMKDPRKVAVILRHDHALLPNREIEDALIGGLPKPDAEN